MKNSKEICDKELNYKNKKMDHPTTKTYVSAVIVNKNYEVAFIDKNSKLYLPNYCVANNENFEEKIIKNVSKQFKLKIEEKEELCDVTEYQSRINNKNITHVFVIKIGNKKCKQLTNIKWITVFEALKIYNEYLKKNICWHFKTKYLEKYKIFKNKYIIETFLNYLSSNDSTWSNLYKDYIKKEYSNWDQYYNTKMKLKRRFLKQVIKYSKSGKPILECGCGTGKGSLYFALLGIDTYAMDLEQSMVDDTNNLSSIKCPSNPIKAFKGNANSIPYKDKFFSVTHSSGVMEHYSDIDIIKMINEQIRVSDYCVFSVPTKYFEKKMLGNERFMTRREWTNIINKSNACIIKKTGYHYKKLNKRIIDIIKKPKRLFKPIALYTFVLKEKGK